MKLSLYYPPSNHSIWIFAFYFVFPVLILFFSCSIFSFFDSVFYFPVIFSAFSILFGLFLYALDFFVLIFYLIEFTPLYRRYHSLDLYGAFQTKKSSLIPICGHKVKFLIKKVQFRNYSSILASFICIFGPILLLSSVKVQLNNSDGKN